MDLLKRHYEKVVLAALLIVFIGAMLYLLEIVKQAKQVSPEQLKIEKREADYAKEYQAKPKDIQYNMHEQFRLTALQWAESGPRDKDQTDASGSTFLHKDYFSDLVVMFPVARCTQCQRLIPRYFFNKVCPNPECKQKLGNPAPFALRSQILQGTATDLLAAKKGPELAPEDYLDKDNDGFSAAYEKQAGTDPGAITSHPPYWHRLVVERCGKSVLPIKFVAISSYEKKDKTKVLLFQVDIVQRTLNARTKKITEKSSVHDIELNDELAIPFSKGSIVGKKWRRPHRFNYQLVKVDMDSSSDLKKAQQARLYWKSQDKNVGDITMDLRKDVYAPNVNVTLLDVGKNVRYDEFMIGDDITIGNKKYRIMSIDVDKNTVKLQDVSRGKKNDLDENKEAMIVTKTGKIPPEMQIGYKTASAETTGDSAAKNPGTAGKAGDKDTGKVK